MNQTLSPSRMLVLLFFPAVLALLPGCSGEASSSPAGGAAGGTAVQPVEATVVEKRDLVETLSLVGSLAPNETVRITPEVSGLVASIHFEEGQSVEKGDLLLKMDDRELQAQLADARARFNLAAQTLERNRALAANRTVPQSEFDRSLAEYERAQAEVELLEVRLDKTEIRAPFSGILGARDVSSGDFLSPGNTITRLDDISRLKVEFSVPERFVDQVRVGAPIQVVNGPDDESGITGEVYFVSRVLDRSTRSSQVRAAVENPPEHLRPGMFANVNLVLREKPGALTVPESAILSQAGSHFVVVVLKSDEGETVEFVPVRLGIRQRGLVEIIVEDGEVDAGSKIVASGVGALILFPGAAVESRPMKANLSS